MSFREGINSNERKSFFLLLSLLSLLVIFFYIIGYYLGLSSLYLLPFSILISLLITLYNFYNADKIVLKMSRAKLIDHQSNPQLFNIVEEVALAHGLKMPKIAIVEDNAPNAFATGRNIDNSIIAFTTGILKKMDREMLQGVAAHELSHIKNRDTMVATFAAVTAGIIALICDIITRIFLYSPSSRRDSNSKGNPFTAIALLLVVILTPIAASLLQASLSRKRESLADLSAVEMTRNPAGLRRALEVLRDDNTVVDARSNAVAHLYIESPIEKKKFNFFATHPPIEERIKVLEDLEN